MVFKVFGSRSHTFYIADKAFQGLFFCDAMNFVVVGVNPLVERFIERLQCCYFLHTKELLTHRTKDSLTFFRNPRVDRVLNV